MSRHIRIFWALVLSGSMLATGCQPVQPFFFHEDGDLSHYVGVATEIDYPDVNEPMLCEVSCALPPLTLKNREDFEVWEITLEEVTRITLSNSKVMRQLGGQTISAIVGTSPETLSRTLTSPVAVTTVYDPALVETSTGTAIGSVFGGTGVEAALAEFDAQLDASIFWNKVDQPQNRPQGGGATLFNEILQQDSSNFTMGITKVTATGTQFAIRNNTDYESNNLPADPNNPAVFRAFHSAWTTNLEASFSHPFLQGQGTTYNRIAGPFSFGQYAAGGINPIDGVMIARIRTDQTLADFEGGVRNLLHDVEDAYWNLYFAYRDLQSRQLGRDSALETWKNVHAKYLTGSMDGTASREAQARSQYYLFKSQVEQALTELFQAEANLRYIMGLAESDGRLIRPADEPTTASVNFDWAEIHSEALVRRVEVRKQKWQIKQRELELIAARNHLLPRLDAVGTYRWRGLGDNLLGDGANRFNVDGSTAFDVLTSGDFQEWQLGLQLSVPFGFRQQISQVRHHELLLAREKVILNELELEVSHQLAAAIRSLDNHYLRTQTLFNRRVTAEREVQTVEAIFETGRATLELLLDAQSRRAQAEADYYRSLVDYNRAIMEVHRNKGSALDYNGVYLAEGPWPGKAYFDALRRARQRDASMYLDYGFTRPRAVTRGPYPQSASGCYPTGANTEPIRGETAVPEEVAPIQDDTPKINRPDGAVDAGFSDTHRSVGAPAVETLHFSETQTTPLPVMKNGLATTAADQSIDIGSAFRDFGFGENGSAPGVTPTAQPLPRMAVVPTQQSPPSSWITQAGADERQENHSSDQSPASPAGWEWTQFQQLGEVLWR